MRIIDKFSLTCDCELAVLGSSVSENSLIVMFSLPVVYPSIDSKSIPITQVTNTDNTQSLSYSGEMVDYNTSNE